MNKKILFLLPAAVITLASCGGEKEPELVAPTAVTVELMRNELREGETTQGILTFDPVENVDKAGTWTTSDASVAKVEEDGYITAVGGGTATITFTSTANASVFGTADIKVKPAPKSGDFGEIDTVASIVTGDYVIASKAYTTDEAGNQVVTSYVMGHHAYDKDGNVVTSGQINGIETTIDDIFIPAAVAGDNVWHIEVTDGYLTLSYIEDGVTTYLAGPEKGTNFSFVTEVNDTCKYIVPAAEANNFPFDFRNKSTEEAGTKRGLYFRSGTYNRFGNYASSNPFPTVAEGEEPKDPTTLEYHGIQLFKKLA